MFLMVDLNITLLLNSFSVVYDIMKVKGRSYKTSGVALK